MRFPAKRQIFVRANIKILFSICCRGGPPDVISKYLLSGSSWHNGRRLGGRRPSCQVVSE